LKLYSKKYFDRLRLYIKRISFVKDVKIIYTLNKMIELKKVSVKPKKEAHDKE